MSQDITNLPNHIAIIMDGNGRWAKERSLPRTKGHYEGLKRVEEIVESAAKIGVGYLTVFAFSTENWNRPKPEVQALMTLFADAIRSKIDRLNENNVRLRFVGSREGIDQNLLKKMLEAEEITKDNKGLTFNVAFNYGARQEILEAIKSLIDSGIKSEDITEDVFSDKLYTKGIPDPDLLVRTSGEYRISNFLLWQLSYAEFYFTEKYWPEFTEQELLVAIKDYDSRRRRYGLIDEQIGE